MPSRFTEISPPLTQTFSFAEDPFLREQFATGGASRRSLESYTRELCNAIAPGLSMPIRLAYGEGIQVTLVEPSASMVSRSEYNYRPWGDHPRLFLRHHFYELLAPAPCLELTPAIVGEVVREAKKDLSLDAQLCDVIRDELTTQGTNGEPAYTQWRVLHDRIRPVIKQLGVSSAVESGLMAIVRKYTLVPMRCHPFSLSSRFGKYLGFVDVRPSQVKSPVAMALLAPPRSLRHDPDAFVITGEYGPLFGGPAFPCSVFSMYDPESSGTRSAQACVVMALGSLSDRLAKVLGGYDITYLAREPTSRQGGETSCLGRAKSTTRVVPIAGLSIAEIVELLQDKLQAIGGQPSTHAHYFCQPDSPTARRMVARLLEAYLLARYPAILPVEASQWWDDESKPEGHAVLIVGMRRRNPANIGVICGIGDLIVHDPGFRPFMKRNLDECIDACIALEEAAPTIASLEQPKLKFESPATPGSRYIQLVFVTESRLQRSGHDCLKWIARKNPRAWEQFFDMTTANNTPASAEGGPAGDFRITLVHCRDIFRTLDLTPQMREKVKEQIVAWKDGWYWCVAGYVGIDLRKLWFFSDASPPGGDPDCVVSAAQRVRSVTLRLD